MIRPTVQRSPSTATSTARGGGEKGPDGSSPQPPYGPGKAPDFRKQSRAVPVSCLSPRRSEPVTLTNGCLMPLSFEVICYVGT